VELILADRWEPALAAERHSNIARLHVDRAIHLPFAEEGEARS